MRRGICLVVALMLVCIFFGCGESEQKDTTTSTTIRNTTTTTKSTTATTDLITALTNGVHGNEKDFTYEYVNDGVVITGYIGEETEIIIPQIISGRMVVEIGFEAFKNSSVKSVTVPFGVKKIGAFAFYQSSLEWIEIPETVTFIGNNAFSYTNLTEFETPMGISVVSAEMLSFCDSLEAVIIGNNITQVDYGAFAFCMSLEAVYVPYTVEYISDDVFEGCYDLILYGEEDSYAEQFAEENEMIFEIV